MNDDLTAVFSFLERCGPEASGHGMEDRGWKNSQLIERFIRGECDEAERRELARFLQENPQFIRQIADRLKETYDPARDNQPPSTDR